MDLPILTVRFLQPSAFRYFWIKYVHGFDPSRHCGKCLVGAYSKRLRYRETHDLVRIPLDEHCAPWIYICGVTARYGWNVHVAGKVQRGKRTEYSDPRVEIMVDNLSQIAIVADDNPPAPKEFATCRNWQFGWTAFPETPRELWRP